MLKDTERMMHDRGKKVIYLEKAYSIGNWFFPLLHPFVINNQWFSNRYFLNSLLCSLVNLVVAVKNQMEQDIKKEFGSLIILQKDKSKKWLAEENSS